MKTQKPALALIVLAMALITGVVAAPRASAVPITFAGGNGTPLSLTLSQPINYTATSAFQAPIFVFQSVGNPFLTLNQSPLLGTITFSINSGPPQPLTQMASGVAGGSLTANDIFFFGPNGPFNIGIGDIITLSIGTLTTTNNVSGAAASGSYNTFITDDTAKRVSTDGTAASVPETLPTLWLGLPLLGMFAARRFRTGVQER